MKPLYLSSNEITTLWLLSMLHTAIMVEGLTQDNKSDLEKLNGELKAIVKRAGLGRYSNDVLFQLREL